MELHKLGHQTQTHTAPANAPHKPAHKPTDGKSTLTEAHAAEHEDAQPGCLECLQQCWDSIVQYVQELLASLFPSQALAHHEIPQPLLHAQPAEPVDEPVLPTSLTAEAASYRKSLALIQAHITDTWKEQFEAHFPIGPFIATAEIQIFTPSSPRAAYRQSFTRSFTTFVFANREHVLALNQFSKKIADELDADRKMHARSFKNFGTKTVGYQLPESRIEMTLACFTKGGAEGACDSISVKDKVRDPTVRDPDYRPLTPERRTFNLATAEASLQQFRDCAGIRAALLAANILR